MRFLIVLPVLLTAACTQPAPVANTATTDINAAATGAQADVDNYAAANPAEPAPISAPASTPAPTALTPPEPGQPGGLADDRTPVSEAPFTPDSAQGAANVVQIYYALIGEKKYARARALWGDKGAASGQSADAFAASFAKYSEYHANVGAPGRIDAGAGQRYVTVPVQPYARSTDGKARYWIGSVVLHRTADIDGATAEQKSWRIKSIDLKPAPPAAKR